MNQKPTLLLLGLLAVGNVFACNPSMQIDPDYCDKERAEEEGLGAARDRYEAQQEADYQKRRSVQVIEQGNVTTYYPSNGGQSWTGYSLRSKY